MTLDDDLRSAFAREAGTQHAPPPDPDGLVRRGRVRRRRRNLERVGAGIAAAVVVGAGGYALQPLANGDGPRVAARPPAPTGSPAQPSPNPDRPQLAPGTHQMFVGRDATGARISADFTVDGDTWSAGDFPFLADWSGPDFAGIGVYQPTALASGRGCVEDETTTDLGRTPEDLAEQLAGLPRSTLLEEPAPAQLLGRPGVHLRLRVDVDCASYYRVAETPGGDRGISYTPRGLPVPNVIIDFWVLDVAGSVVVVDQWQTVGASNAFVEQARAARDSIALVGDE